MGMSAAVRAAAQRRLYYRPNQHQRAYLRPPPRVVRAGPAFALLVPTEYVVHVKPPETGHHADEGVHGIDAAAQIVLILVVLLVVGGKVVVRLIECGRLATTGADGASSN
jgi:hypothetical protein